MTYVLKAILVDLFFLSVASYVGACFVVDSARKVRRRWTV